MLKNSEHPAVIAAALLSGAIAIHAMAGCFSETSKSEHELRKHQLDVMQWGIENGMRVEERGGRIYMEKVDEAEKHNAETDSSQ